MFTIEPVGYVKNSRITPEDDYWGDVISEIVLIEILPHETLKGIEEFSHLEILFYFHLTDPQNNQKNFSVSRPRGNPELPEVGIFAQRKKSRPNKLGTTIVNLIDINNKTLVVSGLDAINETPVIDIKPVMTEFLPKGNVRQPEWATVVMKNYWSKKS